VVIFEGTGATGAVAKLISILMKYVGRRKEKGERRKENEERRKE
jgi:hypothetical protein